jgi:hypothetical protein
MSFDHYKAQILRSRLSIIPLNLNIALSSSLFIFPVILVVRHFERLPQLFLNSLQISFRTMALIVGLRNTCIPTYAK